MYIIADENIPFVTTAFAQFGQVRTLAGRQLTPTDLAPADLVLVRSVTKVDSHLLSHSQLRFLGTATIGYDHIDLTYLQQRQIGFAYSPGCNATAAAEYVISALLITAEQQQFSLSNKTVGIIGCGNVGSRVHQKLTALGITCLPYDPPLQEKTGRTDLVDLATVLEADIITLHVPLEKTGPHPTYHLINSSFLAQTRPNLILINTSRGQVIDETALLNHASIHPQLTLILDVWDQEPTPNSQLLHRAYLATPHIAGYSVEGKLQGTNMIYQAACHHFQYIPTWEMATVLPPPPVTHLTFSATIPAQQALMSAVLSCYDVRRDHANFRLIQQHSAPGTYFDQLRKNYPIRREFSSLSISLPREKTHLAQQLTGLGFQVSQF